MPENETLKCASCDADLTVSPNATEIVCAVCGTSQSIEEHEGFSEVVENSPAPHRVVDVFRYLVRHPVEMLIWRWNWKAALFSGVLRSMIYLFRLIVSGASGSLVQAFHNAAPVWLATLCIMIMLPAFSHTIEFTLHTLNGDINKGKALIISITFSIISAIFNLFAMRRDALLVKDNRAQSLGQDLAQMPKILGEFVFYPLIWLLNRNKKNAIIVPASDKLPPNPDLANRES